MYRAIPDRRTKIYLPLTARFYSLCIHRCNIEQAWQKPDGFLVRSRKYSSKKPVRFGPGF